MGDVESKINERLGRYEQIEVDLSQHIGDRLKQARIEKGLSQEELGQALGYAPAMVSAFETGRRRMKLDDLARVCIVLGKEPDFFLAGPKETTVAPVGLRAQLASLPQADLSLAVGEFLDIVEGSQTRGVVLDLSNLKPDAAAQEILNSTGVSKPPVDMRKLCKSLGAPLHFVPFPDALSAMIVTVASGKFVIGVNEGHSEPRQRFSIAHELGHAVLRHEASFYLECSEDAVEPPGYNYMDEKEGNSFAAALLMDERWIRADFASGLRDVFELAERYKVSQAAMSFRLLNLGLT